MKFSENKTAFATFGYTIIDQVYSSEEVLRLRNTIQKATQQGDSFLKTKDLFAIRQLLIQLPELKEILFNKNIIDLLDTLYKSEYFLTKAIYFDKPSVSNWFVPYHQDISISVNQKTAVEGYTNWTFKKGQYGVQPPIDILQDTTTIRIHLDDTNAYNGALKVIPSSHTKGIIRTDTKDWDTKQEYICDVKKGGAMLMKPLTLHASNKTTNNKQRRVIHLEFCNHPLADPLQWLEYCEVKDQNVLI